MLISPAYAQAAGGLGGSSDLIMSLAPLVLIFAVFYFLLIRPQQKKMKEHREMLANVRRNDRIVTNGGQTGRASCRERECQSVQKQVVASTLQQKQTKTSNLHIN